MPYTKKYVGSSEDYDKLRGERRSFFYHNKVWEEILKQTYSITLFQNLSNKQLGIK